MSEAPGSRLFWPAVAVGWAVMAVGVVGIAGEGRDVPPVAFARWTVGLVVVHDLLVAPAVILVASAVRRLVPPPWRSVLTGALVLGGVVLLFAWPYVQGWGTSSSNASIQPRDYERGLAIVLAVIAGAGVAAAGLVTVRRRSSSVDAVEHGSHVPDGP